MLCSILRHSLGKDTGLTLPVSGLTGLAFATVMSRQVPVIVLAMAS